MSQIACMATWKGQTHESPCHSFVQQPVQQRRRKIANIDGTQRTPDPGMKHAEDVCEHWRTLPSVSRMRYHLSFCKHLKPFQIWLEVIGFLVSTCLYSNANF